MKIFYDESAIEVECPACHAKVGVWCGFVTGMGGTVHERRVRASIAAKRKLP